VCCPESARRVFSFPSFISDEQKRSFDIQIQFVHSLSDGTWLYIRCYLVAARGTLWNPGCVVVCLEAVSLAASVFDLSSGICLKSDSAYFVMYAVYGESICDKYN
jgi:hypothetical protein